MTETKEIELKQVTTDAIVIYKDGRLVVSSRQVAEDFEKEHDKVCRDIKNLIKSQPTKLAGEFFIESSYISDRGRTYPEYLLTRDGFSLLVMGFTGKRALEWKLKYIEAFNRMEQVIRDNYNPFKIPTTLPEALRLAADLAQQLVEQKPLVEFANTVTKSCDNIYIRQMAKLLADQDLKIGAKRLFKMLRDHAVFMYNNEPYQTYIDRGYFVVKETSYMTPYGERLSQTTMVTPKGQIWLVSKVKEWIQEEVA